MVIPATETLSSGKMTAISLTTFQNTFRDRHIFIIEIYNNVFLMVQLPII